jgi:hypothetical protein
VYTVDSIANAEEHEGVAVMADKTLPIIESFVMPEWMQGPDALDFIDVTKGTGQPTNKKPTREAGHFLFQSAG